MFIAKNKLDKAYVSIIFVQYFVKNIKQKKVLAKTGFNIK